MKLSDRPVTKACLEGLGYTAVPFFSVDGEFLGYYIQFAYTNNQLPNQFYPTDADAWSAFLSGLERPVLSI